MKRTIIIAAVAFCFAACNNPSSPARTDTDSAAVNSVNMNNSDTMNNSGNMNNSDTMNNPGSSDSLR